MLGENLFRAIELDIWPDSETIFAFGLDGFWGRGDQPSEIVSQRRYEALYRVVKSGEVTLEQLSAAAHDGPALTTLVDNCRSNPHPGIVFVTSSDPEEVPCSFIVSD